MAEEIKQAEAVTSEQSATSEQPTLEPITTSETVAEPENTETREPRKIENLEKALRVFKKKSAGIISEVRKREAYDSPSVKRKKKSKEARRKKKMGYKFGNRYQ